MLRGKYLHGFRSISQLVSHIEKLSHENFIRLGDPSNYRWTVAIVRIHLLKCYLEKGTIHTIDDWLVECYVPGWFDIHFYLDALALMYYLGDIIIYPDGEVELNPERIDAIKKSIESYELRVSAYRESLKRQEERIEKEREWVFERYVPDEVKPYYHEQEHIINEYKQSGRWLRINSRNFSNRIKPGVIVQFTFGKGLYTFEYVGEFLNLDDSGRYAYIRVFPTLYVAKVPRWAIRYVLVSR